MFYHIILTERCNSQCKYCYEKSLQEFDNGLEKKWHFENSPVDSEINLEKLKIFIEKDSEPHIIFYGGEPLIMMDKIKEIMDNIKAKFYIQTNGKLLDTIPKEYLIKFSKILISIDGDENRTDSNRGEGNYSLILKNINEIRKNFKGEIVARMTLIYPDIFEQIKHLIDLKIFDSFHWQIDAGFYKNDFNEKKFEEFIESYNKDISNLLEFWVNNIKEGKVLKLYPFLGIFESLYYNKNTKLRCGSGYANYTITTEGNISACPIMNSIREFYCGNLDSNPNELKQIFCSGPCIDCKYYNLCGGRCLYSNYANLWPKKGQHIICNSIIHLIEELKIKIPTIKMLIEKGVVKEKDFTYLKYFGPEIIP